MTPRPAGSWLAAQGRLPLAFMALGLVWFAVGAGLTAGSPELLAEPHIAPAVVALVHTWILGFCVTIAVGAIYQLAPVALSTTLWSERLGWIHFVLHALAVPVMVFAFRRWQMPLLGGAGAVLATGVVLFAINSVKTVFRSGKSDAVAWSIGLACVWLVVTVMAGLALVANRWWALGADPLLLLRAHAHLGLVGFFGTLLQGVTFRLVPMFTLGEVPDWRPVKAGLWLSQLGLLVLAPALAFHAGGIAATGGGMIAAGFCCSGWALWRTLGTRKKRRLDIGVAAFIRSAAMLVVAAVIGLWLVWPSTAAGSAPGGLSANVYGVLVILGALVPAIAGMMNKIVPFLTWMRAYGPKVGRGATPPATSLSNARLEFWAMAAQGIALVPLAVGAWTLQPGWLRVGTALFALGTGAFLVNMLRILRHLWHPLPVAPATPAARPVRANDTAVGRTFVRS